MALKQNCERKNIFQIIELINQGENYTKLDEYGSTPFNYLTFEYNEYTPLKEVNKEEYSMFRNRTKEETNGYFEYKDGKIHIHTSIVNQYCSTLKINISQTSALIFVEWCYFKMSPTLQKLTPYIAFEKCVELLHTNECREIWSYLEEYIMFTINGNDDKKCCRDICYDYLNEFQIGISQHENRSLFEKLVKSFFSHFEQIGGNTFIKHFNKDFVVECLDCLKYLQPEIIPEIIVDDENQMEMETYNVNNEIKISTNDTSNNNNITINQPMTSTFIPPVENTQPSINLLLQQNQIPEVMADDDDEFEFEFGNDENMFGFNIPPKKEENKETKEENNKEEVKENNDDKKEDEIKQNDEKDENKDENKDLNNEIKMEIENETKEIEEKKEEIQNEIKQEPINNESQNNEMIIPIQPEEKSNMNENNNEKNEIQMEEEPINKSMEKEEDIKITFDDESNHSNNLNESNNQNDIQIKFDDVDDEEKEEEIDLKIDVEDDNFSDTETEEDLNQMFTNNYQPKNSETIEVIENNENEESFSFQFDD